MQANRLATEAVHAASESIHPHWRARALTAAAIAIATIDSDRARLVLADAMFAEGIFTTLTMLQPLWIDEAVKICDHFTNAVYRHPLKVPRRVQARRSAWPIAFADRANGSLNEPRYKRGGAKHAAYRSACRTNAKGVSDGEIAVGDLRLMRATQAGNWADATKFESTWSLSRNARHTSLYATG